MMKTMRLLVLVAVVLGAQVGRADESVAPRTDDTKTVFMWFGGSFLPGLWLTGHDEGWSVPLPYVAPDACVARMHDITEAPLPRVEHSEKLPAKSATLTLPRPRYTGSHTYRISFKCESSKVADLLIHLDPSESERQAWQETTKQLASR